MTPPSDRYLQAAGEVQQHEGGGAQDVRGDLSQEVRDHQAAQVSGVGDQAVHGEQVLCGEEPNYR